MRHSWATYAAQLDVPDRTIEMALGHGKKKTMDVYVAFDMGKVDKANRNIIDLVFQKKRNRLKKITGYALLK